MMASRVRYVEGAGTASYTNGQSLRRRTKLGVAPGGTKTTNVRVGVLVWLVLAALLLSVFGVARSEATVEPLPITGRVLRAGELPGFVPKERPATVASVAAWNKVAPSGGIDVEARLRRAGFVAAVREDLNGTSGSYEAALAVVVRLGSPEAARAEIAQQVRDFADQPNRGGVKMQTPFPVPGIPGASGWTSTGNDGFSGHNIIFADGPFTYLLGMGWGSQAKSPPTPAQLIAATRALFKRVHGRPAPTAVSANSAAKLPPGVEKASVGDAQIAYRLSGSGRPLLLINGSGATLDTWDPKLLKALGRFRRVIVYDPRGLGGSTGTPSRVARDARDAAGLLGSLGIRRADVIGWSYGGFVAQELAIGSPSLVRKLVLVSTDHGGPAAVIASKQILALDDKVLLGIATPEEILRLLFPPAAGRIGQAWLGRLAAQPGSCCEPVNPSAARGVMASEREWYQPGGGTRSRLTAIKAPTLIVAGSLDQDVPPANAHLLADRIPSAKAEIVPSAGHAVLIQAADHFLSETKDFLK